MTSSGREPVHAAGVHQPVTVNRLAGRYLPPPLCPCLDIGEVEAPKRRAAAVGGSRPQQHGPERGAQAAICELCAVREAEGAEAGAVAGDELHTGHMESVRMLTAMQP
jgi:hypothetical protein